MSPDSWSCLEHCKSTDSAGHTFVNFIHNLDATVKSYSRYRTGEAAGVWCQCAVKARGTAAEDTLLHTLKPTQSKETPDLSPAKAVAAAEAPCVLTEWKPHAQRHLCVHVDHAAFPFSFH